MRKLACLVISCFIQCALYSQVKFNNPSFEDDGPPPQASTVPVGYIQCTSTPDIEPGYYCTGTGAPAPHDGRAYMGLVNDLVGAESFSQRLACPLVAGKSYSFDIWLMDGNCSTRASGQLKIYLSNTTCGNTQLAYTSPVPPKDGIWRRYTVAFTANNNYTYVKFENGRSGGGIGGTGIFLDDIQEVIQTNKGTFSSTNVTCNVTGSIRFTPTAGGTFTYRLYNAAGTLIGTTNPATGLTTGTYRFEVIDQSESCAIPMVYNVTLTGQQPVAGTLTATDSSICAGETTFLNFTKSNAADNYTYSWSPTAGLSNPTSANPSANPTTTTTYVLTVTNASDPTCTRTYPITISVDPMPGTPVSPNRAICTGTSTVLTSTAAVAGIFSWYDAPTGGTLLFQQSGAASSSYTTPVLTANRTYYIRYATTNGCLPPSYDSIVVTVAPVLNVSQLVKTDPGCTTCDGSVTLNVTGGLPAYNVSWNTGATGTTLNSLCRGTTYTATVTDQSTCTATFNLTTPPAVIATFTATPPSCNSRTTTTNTTGSSGPGVWTYTGPGTLTFTAAGAGVFTVNASVYGTYTIEWTVNDATCSVSDSKTITFTQNPVGNFTFTPPACGSRIDTITTTVTVGTGILTYTGPSTATFTEIPLGSGIYQASVGAFGTYTITLLMSNGGCTASVNKSVTYTAQPVATVTPAPPACNALTFTAQTGVSAGAGSWSTAGPGTLNFASSGTNQYIGTASVYGTYNYSWTVTNGSCSATTAGTVTFSKAPLAAAGTDQNICGLATAFAATTSVGAGSWSQVSGPDIA
ncbi:MAG: hypothetical protein V4616_10380, partial [Bacteroidota bacterium]